MRGNVMLKQHQNGLPKDQVVNATQIFALDKSLLRDYVGTILERQMEQIDMGLRPFLFL
ncbi:MAG: type II toxin-antitoxin system PemK/MazF family toxin [Pyrinomonadaceae bacterium]